MVDLENRCSVVDMGHFLVHSSFQRICPNMSSFLVKKCKLCNQPTHWMTTPCQVFMTAYWIYLQLPSISESRHLHPQPKDVPCHGDRDPLITQHISMSSGYIIWGENSKCSIFNTDIKLVSHCDVTCCVRVCVCVCVCVCARARACERERVGGWQWSWNLGNRSTRRPMLWFLSCFPCSEASSSGVDRKWEGFLAVLTYICGPTNNSLSWDIHQTSNWISLWVCHLSHHKEASVWLSLVRLFLFGFVFGLKLCVFKLNCLVQHIMVRGS
jgi:hypothetical protein